MHILLKIILIAFFVLKGPTTLAADGSGSVSNLVTVRDRLLPDLWAHIASFNSDLRTTYRLSRAICEKDPALRQRYLDSTQESIRAANKLAILEELGAVAISPELTAEHVAYLREHVAETAIVSPLSSFGVTDFIPAGVIYLMYGKFPHLEHVSAAEKSALEAKWTANPRLPITHTTLAEDQAYAQDLSEWTGRKFRIGTRPEMEVAVRGRDAAGRLTITPFWWGNNANADDLNRHTWNYNNSGRVVHNIDDNPEGDQFTNSIGMKMPVGNLWTRTYDTTHGAGVRGGSFWDDNPRYFESSFWFEGGEHFRDDSFGVRFVEDLP